MRRATVLAAGTLLGVLLSAGPALGATWYVRQSGSDFNAGTGVDSALRTISAAEGRAGAGDTIYVGAGTYCESVEIAKRGTAGATIAFVADTHGRYTGDAGPVIVSGSGSKHCGFELKKCTAYVRLCGFHVTGFKKEGIKAKDVEHVVIDSCRVYGNKRGIELKGPHCTVTGCRVYSNSDRGIRFDGKNSGSTLSACVVYANGKDGIEIKGLGSCDGDDDDDDDDDDDGDDDDSVCVASVYNCIVYGNGRDGVRAKGGNTSVTLVNNTVVGNGHAGIDVKSKKQPSVLKNNIIAFNGKEGIKGKKGGTISDYNLLWENAHGNYKHVTPGGHDLVVDPRFKDRTGNNYHLSGLSPARNACPVEGAPVYDFEGQPRRKGDGRVDIGADEFGRTIRVCRWEELRR